MKRYVLIAISLLFIVLLALAVATRKADRKPNFVFIIVDAWRYDHFSPDLTPNIWQFAQNGIVFEKYHVNTGYTRPSMAAIFSSQYPQFDSTGSDLKWSRRMGMSHFSSDGLLTNELGGELFPPELATFPEILRENGYRTLLATHNPNIGVEAGYGPAQWDKLIEFSQSDAPRALPETGAVALTDRLLVEYTLNSHQPFLLCALYVDMHIPYNTVNTDADTRTLLREYAWNTIDNWESGGRERRAELMPLAKREYQNAARFVDSQVARFLDQIDLANTIVIITTDHGEMFSLTEPREITHHGVLPEDIVHVPLIIVGPGIEPRRDFRLLQSIDLMPTILALAGAKHENSMAGRDIFSRGYRIRDVMAFTPFETAIITQNSVRRMPVHRAPEREELAESLRSLGYLD